MIESFVQLREIHGLFDDAEAWLTKEIGCPICVLNCGLCCRDNQPQVYSIEASLILSWAIGNDGLKYLNWAKEWLIENHTCAPTYTGIPFGVLSRELFQEWNALLKTPCFLHSGFTCPIHKMRPVTCRAYGVTRLPARYCPRPLGKGETPEGKMIVSGAPGRLIREVTSKFFTGLKEKSPEQVQVGFLPTLLFRQARERDFRELIAENKIASAKLIGTYTPTQILWQEQIEAELGRQKWADDSKNLLAVR